MLEEDRARAARALMAVTETEAACLNLLETLERAREAMRACLMAYRQGGETGE